MKQLISVFNLLCVVVIIISLNGFQSLHAQKKSEKELVTTVNQSFYTAFSNEDSKLMDKVWSHDSYVSAIHPISKDVILGWSGVRDSFDGVFKNYSHVHIICVSPTVHIEGKVAWVLCNEDFSALQGDKPVKLTAAAINMFVKNSGKWLMVHHQATVPMQM